MRRWDLVALLALVAAMPVGVPALGETITVGYLPPGVDYGATDDSGVKFGEVRAQGLVVGNLEPGARDLGTRDECPPAGCRYQLIVIDPAAVRPDPDTGTGAVGCEGLEYGVVDPEPEETRLGSGARLYTGSGPLPELTADTASETTPSPLTPGVGQLCFATPSGEEGWSNDAGDGPLATTQPNPVVILHDPDAEPGD